MEEVSIIGLDLAKKPASFGALRARHADLDPILGLPCRPAASELPHYEIP